GRGHCDPGRAPLPGIAARKGISTTWRGAALESLVALGGKASRETLEQLTGEKQPPEVRRMAVVSLAELDVSSAAKQAAAVLAASPGDAAPWDVVSALLKAGEGGGALAGGVWGG